MTITRFLRLFPSASLVLLAFLLPPAHAGNITLRLQTGAKTTAVRGYDSSGVVFVSVREYASALSYSCLINADRKQLDLLVAEHVVRLSPGNPFLAITDRSTNQLTQYQLFRPILLIDSTWFAPAEQFLGLLDRLKPTDAKLSLASRVISKEPTRSGSRFDITGLGLESRQNGYLLTIHVARKLTDFDAFLSDGWLYVTVPDVEVDTAAFNRFKPNDVIRKVLIFPSPTSVQLTFKVSPDIVLVDPMIDSLTQNLLLALHTRSSREKADREKAQQDERQIRLQDARDRSRLDVIVIDAGHGGKDPGTIGVAGTREKDVALGVALKLGRLIEQHLPGVRVVYTRKTDVFVELDKRAEIANKANGKLFISIHCNSTEHKPSSANGFEIYILRPGKTESAIHIAEKENKAIELEEGYKERYQELTEENFILVTMRQSAFIRYSEEFAQSASDAMANLLKIQNSGVKQAGFYVLVGASMPNVLVETGYLSNRLEERVLRSQEGQTKIAEALFEGIKDYKEKYEEALKEGRKPDQERP